MATTPGYSTVQVKTNIRDFLRYKVAKSTLEGNKMIISDILEKALKTTYPEDIESFQKSLKKSKKNK